MMSPGVLLLVLSQFNLFCIHFVICSQTSSCSPVLRLQVYAPLSQQSQFEFLFELVQLQFGAHPLLFLSSL